MLTCYYCQRLFKPTRTNNKCPQKFCSRECSSRAKDKKQINHCIVCNEETLNPKFCSHSCSAAYNNLKRKPRTKKSKEVTSTSLLKLHNKPPKPIITGPYTKIYLCTCKYSGIKWYSPTCKQIHPDLARTKKEYTYSCQFHFGIKLYPNWFTNASELIKQYGWYSTPGSRNGVKNLNGISRDHLYSVTDGWINKIPAEIIRHPANCNLIPHTQNQSKYKKSTITLDELYKRIDNFNKIYGEPPR
jgi:hypothetical protein